MANLEGRKGHEPVPGAVRDPATGQTFVPLLEAVRLAERDAATLRASTSWRLTAPIRWLLDRLRRRRETPAGPVLER